MAQRTITSPETNGQPSPERLRMTYEEYQAWWGEGRHGEWVDGEVIVFAAPKVVHQRVLAFLTVLLTRYVQERSLGEVLPSPVEMRLRHGRSYREPDIAFVAAGNASRVTEERIDGPADLAIEIVSDDSGRRDRKDKFNEYAEAGIPEYWVIDPRPLRQAFLAYTLTAEGYYEQVQPDADGRVASVVLADFWLDPAWLWQEPLPTSSEALRLIEATVTVSEGNPGT